MSSTILLVDDDASVLASLSLLLKQAGYRSRAAASPSEALEHLSSGDVDLVIQDMNFSRNTTGEEGLSLLGRIKSSHPPIPVILMTGWGSISLAVQGVRAGASDFITKPWSNEQLLQSVKTTLGLALVNAPGAPRKTLTREELDTRYDFSVIIGSDPKLVSALEIAGRVSATDASVLITGESGTGKELIAEAIHRNSGRKAGPFVKVNIGGISSTLFDSEMFGHLKGAFTDARQDRKGRFEIANGGTIFLDEIGDLDPSCQVKMLRVLQDRTFEQLGSSETQSVDVRVVSATNGDLGDAISHGKFREDLLYRLNLIAIHLPPLRERRGDIPLLAGHFIQSMANVYRRTRLGIGDDAVRWLQGLRWSGNIRELKQAIERAVLMSGKDTLEIEDFSAAIGMEHEPATGRSTDGSLPPVGSATLDEIERAMIVKSMEHFHGNISKVAETLGLSRAALYRRCEKFGIKT
jgi:DNA-binding NtrC family response regulator